MSTKPFLLIKMLACVSILSLQSITASENSNSETKTLAFVTFPQLQALLTKNDCVFTIFRPPCEFDFHVDFLAGKLSKIPNYKKLTLSLTNFNFKSSKTQPELGPGKKFRHCNVHLVTDQTFELGYWPKSPEAKLVDVLLLLSASDRRHQVSFPLPPDDFKRIPNSHLVILTVFDFRSVSIISLPCGEQKTFHNFRLTLEPSFQEEALTKLRKLWLSHQNNFHRAKFWINKPRKSNKCGYFETANASFSKDVCNLKLLQSKLNFTLYLTGNNGSFFAKRIMLGPHNLQENRNKGNQWLPHGLQIKSYGFMVVMDKSQIRCLGNPLSPFDIPTWILTYVSVWSVAFLIFISQENGTDGMLSTCFAYKIYILLLLVDQPSRIRPTGSGSWKQFMQILLWSTWALTCLVISQIYRGDIFSNLTSMHEPKLPDSLDGVLEYFPGVQIGTLEFCTGIGRKPVSCAMLTLSENMKAYSKPETMPRNYMALKESMRWIPFREDRKWAKIQLSLVERKSVKARSWNKTWGRMGLYKLPAFVLMEPVHELRVFSQSLENTQHWASKVRSFQSLDRRNLWIIQGRYFHLVLGTYLKRLHEAGYGTRLEGQERQFKLRLGLRNALKIGNDETSGLGTTNLGKYGNCQDGCSKERNVLRDSVSYVSSSVYQGIYIYYKVTVALALIAFIAEIALGRKLLFWKAWKVTVETVRVWCVWMYCIILKTFLGA